MGRVDRAGEGVMEGLVDVEVRLLQCLRVSHPVSKGHLQVYCFLSAIALTFLIRLHRPAGIVPLWCAV